MIAKDLESEIRAVVQEGAKGRMNFLRLAIDNPDVDKWPIFIPAVIRGHQPKREHALYKVSDGVFTLFSAANYRNSCLPSSARCEPEERAGYMMLEPEGYLYDRDACKDEKLFAGFDFPYGRRVGAVPDDHRVLGFKDTRDIDTDTPVCAAGISARLTTYSVKDVTETSGVSVGPKWGGVLDVPWR